MDVPLIEQVKIQAQVLVPLIKTLRAKGLSNREDR
jgi:hypothetical protein